MIRRPFVDACAFYPAPNISPPILYPIRYMLEILELQFHLFNGWCPINDYSLHGNWENKTINLRKFS